MSDPGFRVRPARRSDIEALYHLALQTGGGFTNLPADREALAERLEKSDQSFAGTRPSAESFITVLETADRGQVVGVATVFAKIGTEWPFYSYRRVRLTQTSVRLGKMLKNEALHLVNDFDGCSEVGGLFVDPAWRIAGSGRLLARSRYLFIAQMRERFAAKIVADLRGYQDEAGGSPFWSAVGQHFFDMPFEAADRINSLTGNQFISDLAPRHPIYIQLLPPEAQAAIGRPHRAGEAAYRLAMEEGFRDDGYVDIFDAGPTVYAEIDGLKAVRDSKIHTVAGWIESDDAGEAQSLVCAGSSAEFRAAAGAVRLTPDGDCLIAPELAATLAVEPGETVRHVAF